MRIKLSTEIEAPGLGEKIRLARLASEKSLDKLCKEVDISRTYWYDLEKEEIKGTLSIQNFRKIETALGINFDIELNEMKVVVNEGESLTVVTPLGVVIVQAIWESQDLLISVTCDPEKTKAQVTGERHHKLSQLTAVSEVLLSPKNHADG